MNGFGGHILAGILMALLWCCSKNEGLQRTLIANYSLTSNGRDGASLNDSMTLFNAPFQNGGIYCNGQYEYATGSIFPSPDPGSCVVVSPSIRYLNPKSFSISMDFLVSEYKTQPVWVIGSYCRWLGFYLNSDGTAAMLYNNDDYLPSHGTHYSLNEWHNAEISFDGTSARMFLDNTLACSLKFGSGFVPLGNCNVTIPDNQIGVTNFSTGQTLKGYVKNLKVFSPQ
jgi:hypothetical protein